MRPPNSALGCDRTSVVLSALSFLPVWLVGLGGLALTGLLFAGLRQQQTQQIQAEFDRRVENHMRMLQNRINSHGESLFALRNVFRYSAAVPQAKFVEAAQDLLSRHPGIQALKWVPRVPASDRTAVEAARRAEGLPGYRFTEFGAGGKLVAAASRPEYFPLHFIEPSKGNEKLIGWDVASDPIRFGWLRQACDTGSPSVSERIFLSKEINPQAGVTAIVPVFRSGIEPKTVESRRENLLGFVLGMFRVGDGVEESLKGIPFGGLDVLVVDNSVTGTNRFLYLHPAKSNPDSGFSPARAEPEFLTGPHRVERVALSLDREWLFLFRPSPAFIAGLKTNQPAYGLAGGLAVTLLAGVYLFSARRRSQRVEALVAERTAELQEANTRLGDEIRERGQAEEALRESEQRLRTLIGVSPDAIVVTREGRVTFVNEAALHLFGAQRPEQLQGRTPFDLVHPDFHDVVTERRWQVAELGLSAPVMEQKIVRLDGRTVDVEVAAAPFKDRGGLAQVAVLRDVTERKLAEEERQRLDRKLQEAAKLESLGVMAGGIAHDFNNLLTGILCNACLAKMEAPSNARAQEHLTQVENASLRAAELCKQMLAYSGRGQLTMENLDLVGVARESLKLLQHSISKKIAIQLDVACGLAPAIADATQIRQVIMNLLINASEAIGDNSGSITIAAGTMRASREYLTASVLSPDLPEGEYVFLAVTDTGCGMSGQTIARIFDPFFTTKFTGRGLGLAAVLGIVRGHKGALHVTSQLGRGSTFKLLLPAATGPVRPERPAPIGLPQWQGSGAVLVVDDEEPVRLAAAQALRRLGFDPVVARDGWEALRMFEREPRHYVLVLLDLTMPQLDGSQTFQELRRIRPDVRVVLMSGFDQQEAVTRFAGKGLSGFLQKPFQVQSLGERMQAALAEERRPKICNQPER